MNADEAALLRDLALAAPNDNSAMTELVRRTSPTIWRMCASLVDSATADDLVQDTYVRAVRSLHRFRGDSSPLSWLATIARRVCADEIAQRQRTRRLDEHVGRQRRTVEPDQTGLVEMVDAVRRLPDDRRDAFLLTVITGLTYAEAAEIHDCPVGTIRSRVARARAELIAALGSPAHPEPLIEERADIDAGLVMAR